MIKFKDYLTKCLEDPEIRKYWEEGLKELGIVEGDLSLSSEINDNFLSEHQIWEVLDSLTEDDLSDIIKNKGIKGTPTTTEIEFYTHNGKCPVEEFLNSISNKKLKTKTLLNIAQLALQGKNARPPLSVYVDDGIYELRTKQGSDIDRVFYFFVVGYFIIMTNGYIMKSKKIDMAEFEKAKKYMKDYMKQTGRN